MTKLRTHAKKRTQSVAAIAEPAQGLFESRADRSPLTLTTGVSSAATAVQTKPAGHQLGQVSVFPTADVAVQRKRRTQEQTSALTVQPKLTVGQPGDLYEQEADRVAAQVVDRLDQRDAIAAQPSQAVQKKTAVATQPSIQPLVQAQGGSGGTLAPAPLEQSINAARSGGASLSEDVKQPMEQAFGADFGGVKVHTDGTADQLNRSLNAQAFTTKNDIFFKQGAYNPGDRAGKQLLAHELTHVVQQSGGMVQRSPMYVQRWDWGKKVWNSTKNFVSGVGKSIANSANSVYTGIAKRGEIAKQLPGFKEDVNKEATPAKVLPFLSAAAKGVFVEAASDGQDYGHGKWEGIKANVTSLFSRGSSKQQGLRTKRKAIGERLRQVQSDAAEKASEMMKDAKATADEGPETTALQRHAKNRKKFLLKQKAEQTEKNLSKGLYQEAALAAANDMVENASINEHIQEGAKTYTQAFSIHAETYIEGNEFSVSNTVIDVLTGGLGQSLRQNSRKGRILTDRDGLKQETKRHAHSEAMSDAVDKVKEGVEEDTSIIDSFAQKIPEKLDDKAIQEQALQKQLNGSMSSLTAVAGVIDALVPDDGDTTTIKLNVSIPVVAVPGLFIDFNLQGVADRDGKTVTVGIDVGVAAGGKIDIPGLKLEAMGELGGYVEAKGKSAEEAMTMISYGLYRRFRESDIVPSAVINSIWGLDGASGKRSYDEAEDWGKAVEESMSDNASIELGGYAEAKGEAQAGAEGAAKVGGSVSAKARTARRYDKKTIKNKRDKGAGKEKSVSDFLNTGGFGQGTLGAERHSVETSMELFVGPLAGMFSSKLAYEENLNSGKTEMVENTYKMGGGFIVPQEGAAGIISDALLAVVDLVQQGFKKTGDSWSEVEREKANQKTVGERRSQVTKDTAKGAVAPAGTFLAKSILANREAAAKETAAKLQAVNESATVTRGAERASKAADNAATNKLAKGIKDSVGKDAAKDTAKRLQNAEKTGKLTRGAGRAARASEKAAEKAAEKASSFSGKAKALAGKAKSKASAVASKVAEKVQLTGQTKIMVVIGGSSQPGQPGLGAIALKKVSDTNVDAKIAGGGAGLNLRQEKTLWKWRFGGD